MIKFKSFAQFPVDHHSHSFVPNIELLLRQFVAFAYYEIIRFISCPILHTDFWLSRQSEILRTRRTCENKRKQSRGWTEMYGCYEKKYANAHVIYR